MYALSIRFVLPEGTDFDAMRALLRERAGVYRDVPGLVSKAFLLNAETREYGGNYVWELREDAEAFLRSELFQAAVQKLGEPRELRGYEVQAYVDRGSLELASKPAAAVAG